MSSKSTQKGDRFDREFRKTLNDAGIPAEKILLSDQKFHKEPGDVLFNGNWKAELKHRESISKQLWAWLEGVDVLALKRNNHKTLIVMDFRTFIDLIQDETNTENPS